MRKSMLKGVLLAVGIATLTLAFGSSVLAAQDTEDKMIGPSKEINKEINKESIDKSSLRHRDDLMVPELTKEFERPMSVPDPRANMVMPGRDPLCGPWKNAINHVYCAEGYDTY